MTEERNPTEDNVTLKNGTEHPALEVLLELGQLRGFIDGHPDGEQLVIDLHHFCRGERDRVQPASLPILIQYRFVLPHLSGGDLLPRPLARDVLLSAFRQTPEGAVIADPVEDTEQNRAALARGQAEYERRAARLRGPIEEWKDRSSDGRE